MAEPKPLISVYILGCFYVNVFILLVLFPLSQNSRTKVVHQLQSVMNRTRRMRTTRCLQDNQRWVSCVLAFC